MSDDPLVERTESTAASEGGANVAQAANLFDLRRIIGGVFGVWGVLLIILGITDSDAEIAKAADVNINLWTGLGMLVISAFFLIWAFTRPLGEELAESSQSRAAGGPGRTSRAPAGATSPGRNSASTDPPKPPPTIRAPAAPASLSARTVSSTAGTLAA